MYCGHCKCAQAAIPLDLGLSTVFFFLKEASRPLREHLRKNFHFQQQLLMWERVRRGFERLQDSHIAWERSIVHILSGTAAHWNSSMDIVVTKTVLVSSCSRFSSCKNELTTCMESLRCSVMQLHYIRVIHWKTFRKKMVWF